jgi:hypothetical protein
MRRIVKRDEIRQAEITIVCNDEDDVIGVEINMFQPISLVDFNFERLFSNSNALMQARMAMGGFNAFGQPGVTKPVSR